LFIEDLKMKSYIKIFGPPVLKSLKELQKLSIDMPEVCIMDTIITQGTPFDTMEGTMSYFTTLGEISYKRCESIISKSGESLGDYDFYFEWFTEPSTDQLSSLMEQIDIALTPLGCKYTITTK
jgi:hypothetical protein